MVDLDPFLICSDLCLFLSLFLCLSLLSLLFPSSLSVRSLVARNFFVPNSATKGKRKGNFSSFSSSFFNNNDRSFGVQRSNAASTEQQHAPDRISTAVATYVDNTILQFWIQLRQRQHLMNFQRETGSTSKFSAQSERLRQKHVPQPQHLLSLSLSLSLSCVVKESGERAVKVKDCFRFQ